MILPRELGNVPPPLALVGHKARGLAQLVALKARVPRFGILTAEAFDAHLAQDDVAAVIAAARAAAHHEGGSSLGGWADDASRIAHGEAMVRAILRNPLPVAVRIAVQEILSAFSDDELLAVRASVVGEPVEATVLSGALDSALGVKGKESLEEALVRLMALAVHPRTLGLRESAGLPPIGCRVAVVVQRMVLSEASGVCVSTAIDERSSPGAAGAGPPRAVIRSCWGLAGGIGGRHGSPRIAADVLRVTRSAVAADGIDDEATVETDMALKESALRIDDGGIPGTGRGTRMQAVAEHLKREPSLSPLQARLVAREALRLEAAFGKPQVMSWAFAGRLLHVLDVEPLLVPISRVESRRARTWDDRLLPAGLSTSPLPLTFSVWQRASARGVERAGRVLGVKGVILEDTRPQMPRLIGLVSGRIYGNVEVLTALLDLLPFADKARAALAAATGQAELVPRRAPPPGFWQKQRQKLDESRWPAQLDKIGEIAIGESERYRVDVEELLERSRKRRYASEDPDALIDAFDELEDGLSKVVAALVLSGLTAALYRVELDATVDENDALREHPGLTNDLLSGEIPGDLVDLSRRIFSIVDLVRRRPQLMSAMTVEGIAKLIHSAGRKDPESAAAAAAAGVVVDEDERQLAEELRALVRSPAACCTGELALEAPRLQDRPDYVALMVRKLVEAGPHLSAGGGGADASTLDALARAGSGIRKKAEYQLEQLTPRLKSAARKRFTSSLEGVRRHGRDAALYWLHAELIIDRLRLSALALGERLFEHGLLDQPRDVLLLNTPEIAGLVRGTGVDVDGRPIVAARKRAAAARPTTLPRRVETRGVVVNAPRIDDDDAPAVTAPGEERELMGRAVSGGSTGKVKDASALFDSGSGSFPVIRPGGQLGVVVVKHPMLRDLPLLLAAKAVVAERGNVFGPAVFVLRALGVPAVVDAPQATARFAQGGAVAVDGGRGTVKRARGPLPETHVPSPEQSALMFTRQAVRSDPSMPVARATPAKMPPLPPLDVVDADDGTTDAFEPRGTSRDAPRDISFNAPSSPSPSAPSPSAPSHSASSSSSSSSSSSPSLPSSALPVLTPMHPSSSAAGASASRPRPTLSPPPLPTPSPTAAPAPSALAALAATAPTDPPPHRGPRMATSTNMKLRSSAPGPGAPATSDPRAPSPSPSPSPSPPPSPSPSSTTQAPPQFAPLPPLPPLQPSLTPALGAAVPSPQPGDAAKAAPSTEVIASPFAPPLQLPPETEVLPARVPLIPPTPLPSAPLPRAATPAPVAMPSPSEHASSSRPRPSHAQDSSAPSSPSSPSSQDVSAAHHQQASPNASAPRPYVLNAPRAGASGPAPAAARPSSSPTSPLPPPPEPMLRANAPRQPTSTSNEKPNVARDQGQRANAPRQPTSTGEPRDPRAGAGGDGGGGAGMTDWPQWPAFPEPSSQPAITQAPGWPDDGNSLEIVDAEVSAPGAQPREAPPATALPRKQPPPLPPMTQVPDDDPPSSSPAQSAQRQSSSSPPAPSSPRQSAPHAPERAQKAPGRTKSRIHRERDVDVQRELEQVRAQLRMRRDRESWPSDPHVDDEGTWPPREPSLVIERKLVSDGEGAAARPAARPGSSGKQRGPAGDDEFVPIAGDGARAVETDTEQLIDRRGGDDASDDGENTNVDRRVPTTSTEAGKQSGTERSDPPAPPDDDDDER